MESSLQAVRWQWLRLKPRFQFMALVGLLYLHADWPPKLIQDWFNLTDQQMADVLAYLAEHHDDVEREYQQVLHQADANRRYWEQRNQNHAAARPAKAASPEQEALRAKLRDWKARIGQQ